MPTSSQWNVLTTVGLVGNDHAQSRQMALSNPIDVGLTPSSNIICEPTVYNGPQGNANVHGFKAIHMDVLKQNCDLNISEAIAACSSPSAVVMDGEHELAQQEVDDQSDVNGMVRNRLRALGFRDTLKKTVFGVRKLKKSLPDYKLPDFAEDSQPQDTTIDKPVHFMEHPHSLCFYLRGYSVSHKEVMESIKPLLSLYPGMKIVSMQFFPMKLLCKSMHVENRYVIRMDSLESRDRLCGMQVSLKGNKMYLKRYEEILESERKRANRKTNLLGLANTKI